MQPIARIGPGATLLAQRVSASTNLAISGSLEKLATGFRINRAADDPAGLITSENLRSVLAQLEAETRTLDRAAQVTATADAALQEMSGLIIEAEALAVANANTAGMSDEEIAANQLEIDSIVASVNRIADTTTFNGDKLLDGTATLEAGGQSVSIDDMSITIGEGDDPAEVLADARGAVTTMRGELGAFTRNAIGATTRSTAVALENLSAAESAVRDTEYGRELANLARLQFIGSVQTKLLGASLQQRENVVKLLF